MQGDSAVQDMDFQRALKASPYEEKDLPQLSADIGESYTRLAPEQKQQLQELADDLDTFSMEDLRNMRYFLTYLSKNRRRYRDILQKMYAMGALEEGGVPEEYDPAFFSVLMGLVDQTIAKRGESGTEQEAPEGFAKGGIVSLKAAARRVQAAGRDGDTVLAHITPAEAALLKRMGGAGSTNPKTGLPEYKSFFSKAWGFIKKAAPIILPIALSFIPGVNVIAAGFIGSGLGSLIGGAKPKDALKSAIFGGLTAGIGAGISGAVSGTGFMAGVQSGLPSAFGGTPAGDPGVFSKLFNLSGSEAATGAGSTLPPGSIPADVAGPGGFSSSINQGDPTGLSVASSYAPRVSTPSSGFGIGSLVDKGIGLVKEYPKTALVAAGGLGALAAGGMGGKDKAVAPLNTGPTTRELMAQNPGRYTFNLANFRPRSTTGMGLFSAAEGGLASNGNLAAKGGKVDGPGTGTSDSIPARLSDGEFVFTAKAVRGAGDGSRMKGAKKMYEMMNKFERMA
jgi:hypothetical protein